MKISHETGLENEKSIYIALCSELLCMYVVQYMTYLTPR
jgi:hypothetical protein